MACTHSMALRCAAALNSGSLRAPSRLVPARHSHPRDTLAPSQSLVRLVPSKSSLVSHLFSSPPPLGRTPPHSLRGPTLRPRRVRARSELGQSPLPAARAADKHQTSSLPKAATKLGNQGRIGGGPWVAAAVGGVQSYSSAAAPAPRGAPGYPWPEGTRRPRVCILGGGFGGLYTALRLDSLIWTPEKRPQVLLVDQCDRFVFKPLLYELLTKEVTVWEIAPLFRDLLQDTRIQFLQGKVRAVDPADSAAGAPEVDAAAWGAAGRVTLDGGSEIEYDWLVLSLGAEVQMGFVPGAKEVAMPFSTLSDALAVDNKLTELERAQFAAGSRRPIRVLVVGAGYAGVELSCVVAERLGSRGQVQVADPAPTICPAAPEANREAALKALLEKGVQVSTSTKVLTMSSKPQEDPPTFSEAYPVTVRISAQDGSESDVAADVVLWTVGNRAVVVPASGAPMPFPVAGRGQADVEESLRVKGNSQVFALGDAAAYVAPGESRPLPGTAQVAFQQADYVGWNIWASINKRPLLPFRYQHLGEMMTLGSGEGAVSVGFIDNFFIGGRLAHTARKLAYLYRLPTFGHQAKVGASWLGKAVVDTVVEAQNTLARIFPQSR